MPGRRSGGNRPFQTRHVGCLLNRQVAAATNLACRAAFEADSLVNINQRVEAWRTAGWTGYDQTAKSLSYDEIERERERYRSRDTTVFDDNRSA